jgi:hypothetical protein
VVSAKSRTWRGSDLANELAGLPDLGRFGNLSDHDDDRGCGLGAQFVQLVGVEQVLEPWSDHLGGEFARFIGHYGHDLCGVGGERHGVPILFDDAIAGTIHLRRVFVVHKGQ